MLRSSQLYSSAHASATTGGRVTLTLACRKSMFQNPVQKVHHAGRFERLLLAGAEYVLGFRKQARHRSPLPRVYICIGSVRKILSQTSHGTSQWNHRRRTFRKLVEARNDAAILVQPANMHSMMLRCRHLGRLNSLGSPAWVCASSYAAGCPAASDNDATLRRYSLCRPATNGSVREGDRADGI